MPKYDLCLDRYVRHVFRWRAFHDLLQAIRLQLNPDFGVKSLSTTDLVEWVQETPGVVFYECKGINCCIAGRTYDVVSLDPELSGPARRFTLAHELGHYLLGHGHVNYTHIGIRRRCELHADLFACSTLWPNGAGLEGAKDFLPTNKNPVQCGRELGRLAPDEALKGLSKRPLGEARAKAKRLVQAMENCHVRGCDEVVERYTQWLELKRKFDREAEGGSGSF